MQNGFLIARRALSTDKQAKEMAEVESLALSHSFRRDLMASRHKMRVIEFIHKALVGNEYKKLLTPKSPTWKRVITTRTTPKKRYIKGSMELRSVNKSCASSKVNFPSTCPIKLSRLKTHFKDVIEVSNHLNKTTMGFSNPCTSKDARSYLESKLIDIRQKRMIGAKNSINELEKDEMLSRCMTKAAKDVVERYKLRRKKDLRIRLLTKGTGKLMYNQSGKVSPIHQ